MPWRDWFNVANVVLMALIGGFLWSLSAAFNGGKKLKGIENDIKELQGRMDRAGKGMSDLADDVQNLPGELRLEFATKEMMGMVANEARETSRVLREEIVELRRILGMRSLT